jgi:hypothetical protein
MARSTRSFRFVLGTLGVYIAVGLTGPSPVSSDAARRTLIVLLDAIPYEAVKRLTDPSQGDAALFRDMKGPVPMVSTFPSGTNVAIPALIAHFGVGVSPGYENRHYDWALNKVRGGSVISYYRIEFPWRGFFDVTRTGIAVGGLNALNPVKGSIKQLRKGIDGFVASEKDLYTIYIGETDLVMHFSGPEAARPIFEALETMLREVRQEHPDRPFDLVILSDHGVEGGEPLTNVRQPVLKALKQAGYRYEKKLKRPGDVVLTPYGLVSNLEAYTRDEIKPQVAKVLAKVPGVDLCVFERPDGWVIEGTDGNAVFRRHDTPQGKCWSYEPLRGDPLHYLPSIDAFAERTGTTIDCLPDQAWFEASAECENPDAFFRLEQAFELVQNPASVVCSISSGYMYGARMTEFGSRIASGPLRWTHGALHREATVGFLMSDRADWDPPRFARFNTALLPFLGTRSAVRENAPLSLHTARPGEVFSYHPGL